jgi:transposase
MGEIVGGVAEKENSRKGKLWKKKFNQLQLRNLRLRRLLLRRRRHRSPLSRSRENRNSRDRVSVAIVVHAHRAKAAVDKDRAAAEIVRVVIAGRVPVEIAGAIVEKDVKADAPALVEAADRVPSVALRPISSSKS